MSSLDKSLAIDYYREYPNSNICTIGQCISDIDAIMTSNVGINLREPKNNNTILSHFYSANSNILSIKHIIREGRTVNENILSLKMSCIFYYMILNSYIICCFIRQVDIFNNQLDYLEINFLIMSISAFTIQYNNFEESNSLLKNKKLYKLHYIIQYVGIFSLKLLTIYLQCQYYISNPSFDKNIIDKIYCSYYFIFCIEQLFSTIFLINLISFYRKKFFTNTFFIIYSLVQLLYCLGLLTLNSNNYKYDIFDITYFEFYDELIDSFDDRNKYELFLILLLDFFSSFIFSRIIYFIFNKIAQNKLNLN